MRWTGDHLLAGDFAIRTRLPEVKLSLFPQGCFKTFPYVAVDPAAANPFCLDAELQNLNQTELANVVTWTLISSLLAKPSYSILDIYK